MDPKIAAALETVARLRAEAEDYARAGDMLAASMRDAQASRLARDLRAQEAPS